MSEQIRIRDKDATIVNMDIPKDKLEAMEKIMKANVTEDVKKITIKKYMNCVCCVCGGIPRFQVNYPYDGAVRLERYCDKCVKSVYQRESVL